MCFFSLYFGSKWKKTQYCFNICSGNKGHSYIQNCCFFYSYTWSFLTIVSTCTTCTSRELRLVCKIYPFKFLSRHFTLVKLCIYQSLQFYAPHPKKKGGGILFCIFLVSLLWPSVFAQYHLTPLLDSYQIGTELAAREEMIPIDFKVM